MLLSDFDYHLPKELIAQEPLAERDQSRLLVVNRQTGEITHRFFYELPDILDTGTVIVRNNTKVFKARLFGFFMAKETTPSEVFLLEKVGLNIWRCLTHPGRKFFPGKQITFTPVSKDKINTESLTAKVNSIKEDGTRILEFNQEAEKVLEIYGHVPLPPYIKKELDSLERYQTIYAKESGSIAAPTAGLHFTPTVLERLQAKGISTEEITLHVGQGTFQPVKTDVIEEHPMHQEYFSLSPETATRLNQAKQEGKKILSVGTTTTRVLEYCAQISPFTKGQSGIEIPHLQPQSGYTNLFIYPGYQWKFVDILLTNFHLPKSTLLMLVSSFADVELTRKAYQAAIQEQYRFYSFGDAMLIV